MEVEKSTSTQGIKSLFAAGFHQLLHVDQSHNEEAVRQHVWSNDDLDPTPPSRRTWTAWNFFGFWMAESWNTSVWSVGSSMVASGLLWWHAFVAVLFAHLIASTVTIIHGMRTTLTDTSLSVLSQSIFSERAPCITSVNDPDPSLPHSARLTFLLLNIAGYPVQVRATFGMWGSYWPVFSRSILAVIWFSVQSYFLGQFIDVCFRCIFGSGWTNLHNGLSASAGITTREFVAYFLGWLMQLPLCFIRPHNIRWLFTVKAAVMPVACFGLFIFTVVRAKGPGDFQLTASTGDSTALAFAILNGMNSAINGDFGPLITSEPDISRYARRPRDQILGQALSAPWANTVVALLGIIAASASAKIYGEPYWNPYLLLGAILDENPIPKTKAAVFFCSFSFAFGQLGTNVSANLIPFGADASALFPRYINIVRGQFICAAVGFAIVPWLILTSGATFLQFITGYGIFVANIVAIMIADYYFISRGNIVISDLYTSDPTGRYWYTGGWNWRAYASYCVGLALAFPGLVGSLGVERLAVITSPAYKMFSFGWILSFVSAGVVYTAISKIFPPQTAVEFKTLGFEELSPEKGHDGQGGVTDMVGTESISDIEVDAKGQGKADGVETTIHAVQ